MGPELTGSNRRNLDYLLSNIIDPSAAVPADFQVTVVLTKSGRVISGAVTRRTPQQLELQTKTELVRVPVEEIDRLKPSKQSLMPDGLLNELSDDQIRDLIAYLMSQRQKTAN